jgi:poly(3-hydroxybutyrate) depolymerase
MLYRAYELRCAMLEGLGRAFEPPTQTLRSVPGRFAAGYPVRATLAAHGVARALRLTHDRPEFGVRTVMSGGVDVEVREEVIASTPFGSLVRFAKADGSSHAQPKVLIVPGLAGHFATLVRATVSTMLTDHDVYVADWHNAREVPVSAGRFGLDEYVEHLITFLHAIGPGVHLMGVCQPAVACLVAASVMSEDADPAAPNSLILLAGPVDTRVNPSRVSRFAQRQSLRMLERAMIHPVPRRYGGAGRRVYPGFVQVGGFMSMDPRRHLRAFQGLFRDLCRGESEAAERTLAFYEEYFAVLDIAAEFYLETAQRVFKDNDLPQGRFFWQGRHVDPGRITSALFTIEGALDEMCTPGQTQAAHALCTGIPAERRRHLLQPGVGHYGVFAGSTFEREIYPQIREFIIDSALPAGAVARSPLSTVGVPAGGEPLEPAE